MSAEERLEELIGKMKDYEYYRIPPEPSGVLDSLRKILIEMQKEKLMEDDRK